MLDNFGSCQVFFLGGGSIFGTLSQVLLVLGVTLESGCSADFTGRSTLGTLCSGLSGASAFGSAVASVSPYCVVHQKMLASVFRAAVFLSLRNAKGVGLWIALMSSVATADYMSAEEVDDIFTW